MPGLEVWLKQPVRSQGGVRLSWGTFTAEQVQRTAGAMRSQDHPLRRPVATELCRTKTLNMSFIPTAVKHLNGTQEFIR